MTHRTLVTGFLAFQGFDVNPSALLAQSSGRPYELIDVSFDAAETFLERLAASHGAYDRVLMLGVRGSGALIEVERLARNHVGPELDVRGEVRGPGPIEPGAPATLPTTLFDPASTAATSFSDDAGCYLCNYIYYRALRRFPRSRVGFVHVPPLDVVPLEAQQRHLASLLELVGCQPSL